jgi:HAMP domain-containing protein
MVTFAEFLAGATVFAAIIGLVAWFNGRRTIAELGKVIRQENELTRKELGEMRSEFRDMRAEMRDLLTKILHAIEARGV